MSLAQGWEAWRGVKVRTSLPSIDPAWHHGPVGFMTMIHSADDGKPHLGHFIKWNPPQELLDSHHIDYQCQISFP